MTNISRRSVLAATAAALEKVREQAELMEAATKRSLGADLIWVIREPDRSRR